MKASMLEYRLVDVRRHGLPKDRYLAFTENESDEAVKEHRIPRFPLVGRFSFEIDADYVPLNETALFEESAA